LNQKYNDDVAIIWADAHPDVDQPGQFENHHAHVVSNLIGVGDKDFLHFVPKKYNPKNILYVGLNTVSDTQGKFMEKHGLKSLNAENYEAILKWLQETKKSKVVIHFDLDVLDLREFRSLLIANPSTYEKLSKEVPIGTSMNTMIQLLQSIAKEHDVVGLGITEYFPWDAYFLRDMLSKLPLVGDINKKDNTAHYNWIF
jgi:arginase